MNVTNFFLSASLATLIVAGSTEKGSCDNGKKTLKIGNTYNVQSLLTNVQGKANSAIEGKANLIDLNLLSDINRKKGFNEKELKRKGDFFGTPVFETPSEIVNYLGDEMIFASDQLRKYVHLPEGTTLNVSLFGPEINFRVKTVLWRWK